MNHEEPQDLDSNLITEAFPAVNGRLPELVSTDDINNRLDDRDIRDTGAHSQERAGRVTDYESANVASRTFGEMRQSDLESNADGLAATVADKLHRYSEREYRFMSHRLTDPDSLRDMEGGMKTSHQAMDKRLIGALTTSPRLTYAEAAEAHAAINEKMATIEDTDPEPYAKRMLLMSAHEYVAAQTESEPRHAAADPAESPVALPSDK